MFSIGIMLLYLFVVINVLVLTAETVGEYYKVSKACCSMIKNVKQCVFETCLWSTRSEFVLKVYACRTHTTIGIKSLFK